MSSITRWDPFRELTQFTTVWTACSATTLDTPEP